jgi:hypothetical protein
VDRVVSLEPPVVFLVVVPPSQAQLATILVGQLHEARRQLEQARALDRAPPAQTTTTNSVEGQDAVRVERRPVELLTAGAGAGERLQHHQRPVDTAGLILLEWPLQRRHDGEDQRLPGRGKHVSRPAPSFRRAHPDPRHRDPIFVLVPWYMRSA